MPVVKLASSSSLPIHVRKTVTFDGGAGSGAVGTVDVFTITGRVLVHRIVAYCITNVAGAAATLALGEAVDADAFIGVTTGTDIDADKWWTGTSSFAGSANVPVTATGGQATVQRGKMLSGDIIITVGAANATGGVIVFDVWYEPVTDNGSLVAA